MAPGKKATSKLYQHPKAKTLYLTIPADMTEEEGFPFQAGERVKLELDIEHQQIIISKFE